MIPARLYHWNLLYVKYFSEKFNVSWFMSSRNLLCYYFFLMKLVVCCWFTFETYTLIFNSWNQFCWWNLLADFCLWILSLWNLYVGFSPSEVSFCSENSCMLIVSVKFIYLDIFLRKTCCISIYFIVKYGFTIKFILSWHHDILRWNLLYVDLFFRKT